MEGLKMVMSWIFTGFLILSIICSYCTNTLPDLSSAVLHGAHTGISLSISMAGALLLWSGVGKVMEKTGLTALLAKLLGPLLRRIFPGTRDNPRLAAHLSGNICANFLGLGNAATPMGIRAVQEMVKPDKPHCATNEMCRLVVLNTASIQLIPASVAAVRSSLGCVSPFDILPAVWVTSLLSAGMGVLAAWLMGKLWKND
jgi:spore maturation protein A